MAMATHDSGARWKTFLSQAKEEEITLLLSGQTPSPVVDVSFHELTGFDPEFAEDILISPRLIISSGHKVLSEICRDRGVDLDAMIRLSDLPKDTMRPLREIGSRDIDKLRSLDVIVTKMSQLKPRIHLAVFQCETCGETQQIDQTNESELVEPIRCPADTGCGASIRGTDSTRFNLVMNISRMINNQWLEIQELPENVPSGAQPSRAQVLLEGDLVNKHLPGQRITANVIPVVRSEIKRNKKTPMFDIVYHMVSSTHESVPFTEIKITDEEREQIEDVASMKNLLQLMGNSIAPSIFANDKLKLIKRSLALQLFGGVRRKTSDDNYLRGDIHILLMGDPGVAKSQLLSYMSNISPRGKFATGGGTTGAGLTAAAIRDTFGDGRFALEAGVLPLSDRGLAAIDEFDKISNEDKGSMHPAMEQQRIFVAKGGITATLPARCAILAAANPEGGRFSNRNENSSIMTSFKETKLPYPLASRFDLLWLIRDETETATDTKIARHILDIRTSSVNENRSQDIEFDIDQKEQGDIFSTGVDGKKHLTMEFLRKYVAFAKRNYFPNLNEKAKMAIEEYYVSVRNDTAKQDRSAGAFENDGEKDRVIPITARAIEALIRLTEAHARMHLKDVADETDAGVALAVYKHWRDDSKIEDESELQSGVSASKKNANQTIRRVIREICMERGGEAEINQIYNRAIDIGISESQVDDVISSMSINGEIFSPRGGTYSFVR
tara:strand:+ start:1338 stop:3515 length:2178 start_codon:yes stop_codon:yes gene_type:complete